MKGFFRIGIALFLGAVLLGGAFYYRDQVVAESQEAAAVTVVQTEKKYLPTKDSDGDGMRDWEEELRGTDPLVPNEHKTFEDIVGAEPETAEDTEETFVPETETDKFAIQFFGEYLRGNAGDTSFNEDEQLTFLNNSVDAMVGTSRDIFFTQSQIEIGGDTSFSAMREYGNRVGAIILQNALPPGQEQEITILNRALLADDERVLEDMDPIINSYDNMISEVLAVPVPRTLLKQHLDLLNAMLGVYNDLQAFRNTFVDPLPAMVRFKRYQDDALGLYAAVDNVRAALETLDITYASEEGGSFFFSLRP